MHLYSLTRYLYMLILYFMSLHSSSSSYLVFTNYILVLSYLYCLLLYYNFIDFMLYLAHTSSYFHSLSLSMSLDLLPYYYIMSNYIYLYSSLLLSLLMLRFHLSVSLLLDSVIYYMSVLSYLLLSSHLLLSLHSYSLLHHLPYSLAMLSLLIHSFLLFTYILS